jgi:hypothetical protein
LNIDLHRYFCGINSTPLKKILLPFCLFAIPVLVAAQEHSVFIAAGAGYTMPSGDHHSDYSSTLISQGSYTGDKKFTYNAAAKIGYRYGNLGAGIAFETGVFQTQHDASVSPITLITLDGTIYQSGKYLAPQVFLQYRVPIWKGVFVEPGVSAGSFMSSASGGEGIGVFNLPSQLSVLGLLGTGIPSRFGVQSNAGATGATASRKFLFGAQVSAGYRFGKHWSAWGEAAYRSSKVDVNLDVLNITTLNTSIPVHYLAFRIGAAYELAFKKKAVAAAE